MSHTRHYRFIAYFHAFQELQVPHFQAHDVVEVEAVVRETVQVPLSGGRKKIMD